ncbi:MAG: hypothetical protein L6R40_006477 [Gallowayella cf. fulva]|nr:MAG: hypothetical protein L6R40_006477 [Xanthomendoza cf. fulva]
MASSAKKSVCLAYSGGLAWLLEKGYEVVCFMANVGQEEDFDSAKAKAEKIGAKKCIVEDLREQFVTEFITPAIQCNAKYEGKYLLGTSLARPVIARAMIAVAKKEGCFAVSHGCSALKLRSTGKGNDQVSLPRPKMWNGADEVEVRFELGFYALQPDIVVIAPWRDPEFYDKLPGRVSKCPSTQGPEYILTPKSAQDALLDYAAKKNIPVTSTKAKPWSMDENLAHCSYEAGILEECDTSPPPDMWKLTIDPEKSPDKPEHFTVEFTKGIPTRLEYNDDGKKKTVTEAVELFTTANAIARRNGVGRIDILENRFVGIKSRGCYETPGLSMLHDAHMDIEGLTLDREVRALRDQFVTFNYSRILYNGLYFSPEREFLHASIVESQKNVNGTVRCKAYKGLFSIEGRSSESKLYDAQESSMDGE